MVSFVHWVNILYFIFVGLFWFCCGCIYICVYLVTFFIAVKNLCLYSGLLKFCGIFLFFLFSFFFHFLKIFPLFYTLTFNFLNLLYFSTFIPLFAFPTVLCPLQLNFNVYKSFSFFSFFPFLSTYLLVLFSLFYSPLGTLL